MTIQIIRKGGKFRGIAFMRHHGKVVAANEHLEYWRICDHCTVNEAVVFCRAHSQFVCDLCLSWHNERGVCAYISSSVAREISATALIRAEVEA